MDVRRCPACGDTPREGQRFCTSCGSSLGPDVPAQVDRPSVPESSFGPAVPADEFGAPTGGHAGRWKLVASALIVIAVLAGVAFVVKGREPARAAPVSTEQSSPAEEPDDGTIEEPDPDGSTPEEPVEEPSEALVTASDDGLVQVAPDAAAEVDADVLAGVIDAFHTYFSGVNDGGARSGYDVLTNRLKKNGEYRVWRDNVSDSYDTDVFISDLQDMREEAVRAEVSFTSEQPGDKGPEPGETCTHWSLVYTLVPGGSGYLINSAKLASRNGHTPC